MSLYNAEKNFSLIFFILKQMQVQRGYIKMYVINYIYIFHYITAGMSKVFGTKGYVFFSPIC